MQVKIEMKGGWYEPELHKRSLTSFTEDMRLLLKISKKKKIMNCLEKFVCLWCGNSTSMTDFRDKKSIKFFIITHTNEIIKCYNEFISFAVLLEIDDSQDNNNWKNMFRKYLRLQKKRCPYISVDYLEFMLILNKYVLDDKEKGIVNYRILEDAVLFLKLSK